MRAGGIFGGDSLGALGIDPPFPDAYGCDENAQCQSGWCNTAIQVPGAKGQCQTKGKIVAGIGGKGESGSHCSSDDNCAFGFSCNPEKSMCESTLDPGNVCYVAHQIGQQDADVGTSRKPPTAEIAEKAGVKVTSDVTGKAEGCYRAGYNARLKASKSPASIAVYDVVASLSELWDKIVGKYRPLSPVNEDVDEHGTPMVYRRVKEAEVTPALAAMAARIIRQFHAQPFGTNIPFTLSGKPYAVKVEQHYHEPGGPLKPWGYHKGSSTFILEPKAVAGFGLLPNISTDTKSLLVIGACVAAVGGSYLVLRKPVKANRKRRRGNKRGSR
jgi:hypothetical protein